MIKVELINNNNNLNNFYIRPSSSVGRYKHISPKKN